MTLSSGPESFGIFNTLATVAKLIDVGAPIITGVGPPISGTSGTLAKTAQGCVYIDISVGSLYMNHGPQNDPSWILIGTAGGFNSQGHSSFTLLRGHFDASIHETSVGVHNFLDAGGSPIPVFNCSHVLFAWIDTRISVVSAGGGGELSLGTSEEPTDIQSEVGTGFVPWNVGINPVDLPNDWNNASKFVRFQADGFLAYFVINAPIIAGQFDVFCYYVQYEQV